MENRIAKFEVTHPDGSKFISVQVFTSEVEVASFLRFALDAQHQGYSFITLGIEDEDGEPLDHLTD
tara:strand:- start:216 stop:413 length:198 start_codon:yes stop_codon:yes gene_type:complete